MRAYTPAQMRDGDRYAIDVLNIPAYDLMKNAAQAILTEIKNRSCLFENKKVIILCGKGNNGGDGYAVGKLMLEENLHAVCANVFSAEPSSEEARRFKSEYEALGGKVIVGEGEIKSSLKDCSVCLDCIFGTGFSGDILRESVVGRIIDFANGAEVLRIAADAPSGVDSLDGCVAESTFKADVTVSLSRAKPGLYSYPAIGFCGEVKVCDINIPNEVYERFPHTCEVGGDEYVPSVIPRRCVNANKGTFGRLLSVVGSRNMTGAASLSAQGALRSGVGLLNIASEQSVLKVLKTKLDEPIYTDIDSVDGVLPKATALLVGCGLGRSKVSDERVYSLISEYKGQIILDADGINAVADNINVLKKTAMPPILTPHPLEFARLSGMTVSEVNADRIGSARRFAEKYGCIVALKGAATVVTDGQFIYVNNTGNSGLSKGGSGDVLAGVIASLAAQGVSAINAAIIGVYVHGLAADRLVGKYSEYGLLPSDLPCEIGKLLGSLGR